MRFVAVVAATSLRVVSVLQYYGTKGSVPMLSWLLFGYLAIFSMYRNHFQQSVFCGASNGYEKQKFNVQV